VGRAATVAAGDASGWTKASARVVVRALSAGAACLAGKMRRGGRPLVPACILHRPVLDSGLVATAELFFLAANCEMVPSGGPAPPRLVRHTDTTRYRNNSLAALVS
jgi:hypothetical protein